VLNLKDVCVLSGSQACNGCEAVHMLNTFLAKNYIVRRADGLQGNTTEINKKNISRIGFWMEDFVQELDHALEISINW
jgi:hypothetical protein